jgi:RNA polymerase sigma-70 factor (ECF subfamily)
MCKNEYRKLEVVSKYKAHVQKSALLYEELNVKELRLSECIKSLPQEQRSLIVLRFKIKLTIKEMAEIYQCPEGTIKSRLFYATKELSKQYKE